MTDVLRPYNLRPDEGEPIFFRGAKMVVKVDAFQSHGMFSLIEMTHPPDVGPALHIHSKGDEAFYVLDGHYSVQCGESTYEGTPGSFIFVPMGVGHNYKSGPNGGRVLVISPAGLEGYFREVSQQLSVRRVTLDEEREIASRYGQEFLDMMKHWGQ